MQILESPEMMSKLTLFNGPPDYTHGDSPSTNSYQHGHFDMLEESDPGCRTMTCDVSAAFWDELVAKPNAEVNARCQTYLWKLSAKRQSFYEKVSTRILRSVRRHELRAECYEKWRQSLSFDDQRLIKRVYGDMADYDIWVFEFLEADEWKLGTSQRDGQRHTNEIRDMCRGESLHSEHPLSEDEEAPLRMPAGLTPSDRKDGSLNPVPDFTRYPGQSRSLSHPRPTSLQTKLLFYSTLFWIACPIVSADGKLQGFARIAQPMSGGISALSGFSITALHDDPRVVKEAYYSGRVFTLDSPNPRNHDSIRSAFVSCHRFRCLPVLPQTRFETKSQAGYFG
ncbi:hypothetical protein BU16DRAFT_226383 [Lophium mytilinum]|uniref:Uncharacterized protein n=1 Tax=Lophium mytilinum TaxID=390894 RepID=A0A6A6Q7Q8_9PEZI|nr:hypothetical protein BU16DRAFT_226383 [Lophium mytilinum]